MERIAGVRDDAAAGVAGVEAALVAVRELAAWTDAQQAGLVGQLSALVSFPEATIAEASKTSVGVASKARERSETLAATPRLAESLADGAVTAAHVDAVTRGCQRLDVAQRGVLFDRVESIVAVAEAATVEAFAKRIGHEVRRIQADDGLDRLERQRRDTRLSSWVDNEGM